MNINATKKSVYVQLPKLRESVTIETLRKAVSSATSSLKLPSDLFMFKLGLHSLVQIFRVSLKTFKVVLHDSKDTFWPHLVKFMTNLWRLSFQD